ncbi:hypothetical protein Scep_018563 [Stephania cephalantha]|uniref:Uncharacterized protein n=1 Tax=Stephania cephalantha TaxID=152367 RepID=A0AAP0I9A5_9MAGN
MEGRKKEGRQTRLNGRELGECVRAAETFVELGKGSLDDDDDDRNGEGLSRLRTTRLVRPG